MKKTLLSLALLAGAYFSATAQQNISFETSEGYTANSLSGQNGWMVFDSQEDGSGPNTVVISTERHSAGTQSLKFIADEEQNFILYDTYKTVTTSGTLFSITQDVYIDGLDPENGSEFDIIAGDVNNNDLPIALVYFNSDGTINIMSGYDASEDEVLFTNGGTFETDRWYEVKTTFNTVAGTVAYYINNQLVYTGNTTPGFEINAIGYTFDAYSTSFFVDNINITSSTAGLEQQLASKFTVSPNPATGIVNINNTTNAILNKITITDLNGRTVKTTEFKGIATAQITIADLASGIYLLNISSDKGTVTKKIIKS